MFPSSCPPLSHPVKRLVEPSPNQALDDTSLDIINTVNITNDGENIPLFGTGHGLAGRVQPGILERAVAANLFPSTPNRPIIIVHNAVRTDRKTKRLLPPGPAPHAPRPDLEKLKKWQRLEEFY
jgi:hypothetical protein